MFGLRRKKCRDSGAMRRFIQAIAVRLLPVVGIGDTGREKSIRANQRFYLLLIAGPRLGWPGFTHHTEVTP
ncbi:hypothetical protein D3X12_17410 [Pseudomonas protegens]|nr:hypothetical protein CEP86_27410 [Pseudomonas protegens]POA82876.1 hypothetical protein C1883_27140 [Pseudomonas protegens]PZP08961.1 MAG: hypothetical protein DI621_07800 [Pseudomonas protegens]QEZ52352.1 hypothetical protein D3X12_17410 [Pseudomonas protegens]QEZ55592.1 hypothetical protein D4N38_02065 [Pseudomonas protegens]